MFSADKVSAVYELREAVEEKVRAEVKVETDPTREAKDTLLEATLEVERQTQRAIEVCHACGRAHRDEPECPPGENVRAIDFGREENQGRG